MNAPGDRKEGDAALAAEGDADPAEPAPASRAGQRARRIVAIGGGKGGTGKSLIAANVGIYLAQLGKRVVLLDADLGGANLHTFLGVERPALTIGDLLSKRVSRIEDVVVETSIANLGLVSGESGPSWMANPRPAQKFRLLSQVRELEVDYLVVDLGPGSGLNSLDFFLVADVGVLVVVPEPTSVENCWRFMKSAFLRTLRRAGLEGTLPALDDRASEGGIPAPLDLYEAIGDPAIAARVFQELRTFRPRLVVNEVRTRADRDLGAHLASAGKRRLGIDVAYLGHIEADDAVWLAVRKRRPLLVEQPESRAAKDIERIVRRLLGIEASDRPAELPPVPTEQQSYYQVLEVEPSATDEEIRRAVRRMREVYGRDSLVTCGLYAGERLERVQRRIEEAYDVLIDADRRRQLDARLFPEGAPAARRRGTPALGSAVTLGSPGEGGAAVASNLAYARAARPYDEPPPEIGAASASQPGAAPSAPQAEPMIDEQTEITGGLLRRVREARGIDLQDIANRTKVGVPQLRAIEQERWDALPAAVYLRGFLVEYARYLRLDPARVARSYMARRRAARGSEE